LTSIPIIGFNYSMGWTVKVSPRAQKQMFRLPVRVIDLLLLLVREIECHCPVRGNWPNYSQLAKNRHHCHVKKGRPTYVAVWEVVEKEIRVVEVLYVGSHEKAPY